MLDKSIEIKAKIKVLEDLLCYPMSEESKERVSNKIVDLKSELLREYTELVVAIEKGREI